MPLKIGISLVAFKNIDSVESFMEYFEDNNIPSYFELSYTLTKKDIKTLAFLKGKTLSVHAPCPSTEYYPNFGSSNSEIVKNSFETLKKSAETAADFGGDIVVLHPGYTLDVPVYSDYQKRKALLEENKKEHEYIRTKEGGICKPEYVKTDLYRNHILTTVENLKHAAEVCEERGVSLAIENLNPRITYLFQIPDDLIFALENMKDIGVCLDLGHLWISSLLYRFNYLKAVKKLAETGRVLTVHVHNNYSEFGEPSIDKQKTSNKKAVFSDDHNPFWMGNAPIDDALKVLKNSGVKRFIIESVTEPKKNLLRLSRLIGQD